jgi:hypothetical protein
VGADEERIEGLLVRIECAAGKAVFHVQTADGVVATPGRLQDVDFITYRDDTGDKVESPHPAGGGGGGRAAGGAGHWGIQDSRFGISDSGSAIRDQGPGIRDYIRSTSPRVVLNDLCGVIEHPTLSPR